MKAKGADGPPRMPLLLALAISAAGIALSAYLTHLTLALSAAPFCSISEFLSCEPVLASGYSKVLGIPVATVGLAWFAGAFALTFKGIHERRWLKALLAWSLLGAVGVGALVYVELLLIGSLCPLCTAAHAMGISILGLAVFALRRPAGRLA